MFLEAFLDRAAAPAVLRSDGNAIFRRLARVDLYYFGCWMCSPQRVLENSCATFSVGHFYARSALAARWGGGDDGLRTGVRGVTVLGQAT